MTVLPQSPPCAPNRVVAEHVGHELVPQVADVERPAGLAGRVREAEAGQAGHHDVERVARIAAVRRRIREQRDELQEAVERVGEAVREHDRQRRFAAAASRG